MPTPISWTLVSPPAPASPSGGGVGSGSPQLPGPITPYTQQDFLDLFDRILPSHYLEPLKSPGPGYELLQAAAAMGARASQAVADYARDAYVLSAAGGAFAVGAVEFYRPFPNVEGISVTVLAGTLLRASRSGRTFVTTEDAVFGPSDLGPVGVAVRATAQGYDYNVPGIVVAADGTTLEGDIDEVVYLAEEPPVGGITFQLRHPTATTGGADPSLDQHGADRLIPRTSGEVDTPYRGRIRSLPDNISPDAVARALQQILLPYGSAYQLIETFEMDYQTCWDGPPEPIAGSAYDPTLCVFDDPRNPIPFRNRWLDTNDYRGAFIVAVPAFGPVQDVGMAFDDSAASALDLANPLGGRAVGAWDVPGTLAFGYLQGGLDGYDLARASTVKTLYDTLQSIKAAGISAAVEREGA